VITAGPVIPCAAVVFFQVTAVSGAPTTFSAGFADPSSGNLIANQFPTTTTAAAIEAAIVAGQVVQLPAGTITITDRPIALTDAHSGGKLLGTVSASGRPLTRLVRGFAQPDSSQADVRTNAMITVQGRVDTSYCNTTVGTSACARSNIVRLSAAITASLGQWVLLSGANNGGTDENEQSNGGSVISWEMVKLAANVAASTDITTKWDTYFHHSNTVAARGVVPATDIEISGIDFACDGDQVAVGILLVLASNVRLDNIWGGGLSRAIVDAEDGCVGITYGRIHSRGECGSAFFGRSVHAVQGMITDSDFAGKRLHALGVPRHLVDLDQQCSNSAFDYIFANHCLAGARHHGGCTHVHFGHVQARDCDITSVQAASDGGGGRNPEILPGDIVGIAFDCGDFGPLATAAFGQALTVGSIEAFDCCFTYDGSHDGLAYAVLIHDTFHLNIGTITIVNNGQSGINNDIAGHQRRGNGLRTQDANGRIGSVVVRGCLETLHTSGGGVGVYFESYESFGNAGNGTAWGEVIIDHVGDSSFRIERMKLSNTPNYFMFGSNFLASPDNQMRIGVFGGDSTTFGSELRVVKNSGATNFANGDVVIVGAASGSYNNTVATPGAPDNGLAVVVVKAASDNVASTAMFVSKIGDGVTCTSTGAVAPGDILVTTASRTLTTNAGATLAQAKARSISTVAAGGTITLSHV
jgi:hypothetical protein